MAFAACCISLAMAKKEILVVYKDRRRPVTFDTVGDEKKNIYEAVKGAFVDVLPSAEVPVFLQIDSKDWGLVDVTGSVPDRSTVYLKSSEDEVIMVV